MGLSGWKFFQRRGFMLPALLCYENPAGTIIAYQRLILRKPGSKTFQAGALY